MVTCKTTVITDTKSREKMPRLHEVATLGEAIVFHWTVLLRTNIALLNIRLKLATGFTNLVFDSFHLLILVFTNVCKTFELEIFFVARSQYICSAQFVEELHFDSTVFCCAYHLHLLKNSAKINENRNRPESNVIWRNIDTYYTWFTSLLGCMKSNILGISVSFFNTTDQNTRIDIFVEILSPLL